MNKPIEKRRLFRWIGWFFFTSSIILFLLQLSFLKYLPNLHEIKGATTGTVVFAYVFLFASYVTQSSLLMFACALITLFFAALLSKRTFILTLGIAFTSVLIMAQIFDAVAYSLYQSHEISLGFKIFRTGTFHQVIPMSLKEILLLFGIGLITIGIQSGAAIWVWRRVQRDRPGRTAGVWVGTLSVACFCFSYGMMGAVLSLPKKYQINDVAGLLLLKASRVVPYYPNLFEFIMPIENPYKRTIHTQSGLLTYQTQAPSKPMHYPLQKLKFTPQHTLPNIVFLVIDAWRFDALNKSVSPNIYRFAAKTVQFKNHWSGGNCTQAGIFTLFYGLPANYWNATISNQKGPVFIKTLEKNNYEMAIYSSASLKFPAFNKNIFIDIKNLRKRTKGPTSIDRDKQVTLEFQHFLKIRNKRHPFFSFLLYDSAHNYCGNGSSAFQNPFQPAIKECARFSLTKNSNPIPYVNRYRNAVHFIDQEIQKVLEALKKEGLYKNTLIIITSDHGEQFNDERLGYWSHSSAYSPHQLHIPLLIYWPGKTARVILHFTTHFDVTPTLMNNALHCQSPTKFYAIGRSLFDVNRSSYMFSASYTDYAVLLRQRYTTFYPNGAFSIKTTNGEQIPYASLDTKTIIKANQDLSRFFQSS